MASAMLRTLHPQMASVVALAAGIAALTMSASYIGALADTIQSLEALSRASGMDHILILKLCGIAIVAEFASDICRDAGETALAHRIDTGVKLSIVASALPMAGSIIATMSEILA